MPAGQLIAHPETHGGICSGIAGLEAVLAGPSFAAEPNLPRPAMPASALGIVGRNNSLLHPPRGPRIRLRSILAGADPEPTPVLEGFDSCRNCEGLCRTACPVGA